MKAPISACLIVRNDPRLPDAVASIRHFVSEVCIVYTGPASHYDESSFMRRLADSFAVCPDALDDEGHMADFALARNASFALATQPWILWLDSDDRIEGAEHLDAILGCASGHEHPRLLGQYEYAHDKDTGACSVLQTRERIVRNDGFYEWQHPVHEVLVAKNGKTEDLRIQQPIRWIHQPKHVPEDGRNLRILRRALERPKSDAPPPNDDAWLQLNLGTELWRAYDYRAAAAHLERYIEITGWEDEKVLAMLRLAEVHQALDLRFKGDAALWWVRQAIELRPHAFEPRYAMGKLLTLQAKMVGDDSLLTEANRWFRMSLETVETDTPLVTQPLDRTFHVYNFIRTNAECFQDWRGALDATEALLEHHPNDGPAKLARMQYRAAVKLAGLASPALPDDAPIHWSRDSGPSGLDIVFLCGESAEVWNPQIAARDGIGGSETAVIEIAKRLADKGHRVKVYGNCGQVAGLYDGVEYTPDLSPVAKIGCDVMVAWRNAELLSGMAARVKLIWAHDIRVHNLDKWTLHLADKVIAVSEWHAGELVRQHGERVGLTREKIVVMRNGIDPARLATQDMCPRCLGSGRNYLDAPHGSHEGCPACTSVGGRKALPYVRRNQHKAIYSSSPDRGLSELLDMWPAIRAQAPDAELHVFYGAKMLTQHAPGWAEQIAEKLRACASLGVVDRGRVNQATLAREMLSAGCWLFPSWHISGVRWEETSCIGVMEAQAAGLRVVTSPYAALKENALEGAAFVEGDARTMGYQTEFAYRTLVAMHFEEPQRSRDAIAAEARARFDWNPIAEQWHTMLTEMVGKRVAA